MAESRAGPLLSSALARCGQYLALNRLLRIRLEGLQGFGLLRQQGK